MSLNSKIARSEHKSTVPACSVALRDIGAHSDASGAIVKPTPESGYCARSTHTLSKPDRTMQSRRAER
eukprot:7863-Heterococcus_DN1.PRE.2